MENAVLDLELETPVTVSEEGIEIILPESRAERQYLSILSRLLEHNTENRAGVWILNLSSHQEASTSLLNLLLYLAEHARRYGCEIKLTGFGKTSEFSPSDDVPLLASPSISQNASKTTTWSSSFGVVVSANGSQYEVTLHPF